MARISEEKCAKPTVGISLLAKKTLLSFRRLSKERTVEREADAVSLQYR